MNSTLAENRISPIWKLGVKRSDRAASGRGRPESSDHDYDTWQTASVEVRGRRFVVCTKRGIPAGRDVDVASALLAETLDLNRHDTVLNLNCGAGLVGAVAATLASNGRVLLADPNVVAVEAARRTLQAHGATNVAVFLSAGTSHLSLPSTVDVVAARLPKGRLPTLQIIRDAFQVLRPGGRFYLAGANDEGIQSALERVAALFGNVQVLIYRKGCRVGVATRDTAVFGPAQLPERSEFVSRLLDHRHFHEFTSELRGRSYVVCSRPGVFCWDRLDAGTRALIETMEVNPGERVLDLGCGTGIVGVVAASLSATGTVHLVDSDVLAVESATQTARQNGISNCVVLPSDSTSAVRDLRFDVVVTNPPFHLAKAPTYDVAWQFVEDAARVLRPGGRCHVVANRFLPYETHLSRAFTTVDVVYTDRQYKVLRGRVSRPRDRSR